MRHIRVVVPALALAHDRLARRSGDERRRRVPATDDGRAGHARLVRAARRAGRGASRRRPATASRSAPPATRGTLTNKLVLTKDDPIGDVAFGVDNTFASPGARRGRLRAVRTRPAGGRRAVRAARRRRRTRSRRSTTATSASTSTTPGSPSTSLDPPTTLDDLTDPALPRPVRHPGRHHQLARAWPSCSPRSRRTATTGRHYWERR